MDDDYKKALETAEAYMQDVKERGEEALGGDVIEHLNSLMTPEEIAESNLMVALIGEMVKARNEKGISRKKLAELSGVKQPVIARMEKGYTSLQLDTVLKVLGALGKTLTIVPINQE